jgi:hypothetical protein
MPFVLEMGARDPKSVVNLVRNLIPHIERIEILWNKHEQGCEFETFGSNVETAIVELKDDKALALQLRPAKGASIDLCLLCSPRFSGLASRLWYASIDGITDPERFRVEGLRTMGMEFISLSIEDSLDLDHLTEITDETFPWQDWRLVEAAVGDPGQVPVRHGPAFSKLILARP